MCVMFSFNLASVSSKCSPFTMMMQKYKINET